MSDYGLLTGFWRCCRPKVPFYGAFPSGFLLKARRALGVPLSEPVLFVCSGRARDYSSPEYGIQKGVPQRGFGPNDRTLDLDPDLQPDFLQDAREPFPAQHWAGILIDRPYTPDDAAKYFPGADLLPHLGDLLRNAAAVLLPGARVGVLDYLIPSPAAGLELVALYAVMCGFNNRIRAFSVYEMAEEGAEIARRRISREVGLFTAGGVTVENT